MPQAYTLKKKQPKKPTEEELKKAGFNFISSQLKGDKQGRLNISASLQNPTSLQFGPDGRLYVTQLNGLIKVFTIVKNGPNNYSIANQEVINLINEIPNHNDDGSLAPSITVRQVTGLVVTGSASVPIIYVSSSDSRMGGPAGDLNLDTNSGIISKLTKTSTGWDKIDLVRGLPRSEENHSVEGMAKDGNMLYLAIGGHTNAGSPSTTFAYTPEYALSAAVLSIDLAAIEAMSTKGTGPNKYKYDIPTLDDPTRPGNPDANDPFGGNDGLNQAKIVPGGPVQVFATGFRNAYDLVITKARKMYVTDNGANPGWGGHPQNEGTPNVNNNYVSGEPGSTTAGPNDPRVNNLDHFHYVGDLRNYVSGSYYAGHPNPIRANPAGAGLYTHDGQLGVWRTTKSGLDPLPADWPPVPVSMANPIESDFQNPGETNNALLTFNSSTNGIAEYTASNFNNGLKGHLLAASFDGTIQDIELTADGTDVLNSRGAKRRNLKNPFASNFAPDPAQPLDITAQGDNDIFPGTVWVVCYLQNSIYVFEPREDPENCVAAYSTSFDDDGDGYSNADEIDNGTNPCTSASRPSDADGDFLSDFNDPDDDNDGLNDDVDYFALDPNNGMTTRLPVHYEMFNNDPGTGLFGLGFTGLMLPKQTGIDYLDLFDDENLIAGGAVGALGIEETSPGDAFQGLNTQENGFQFGVNTSASAGPYTAQTRLLGAFFNSQIPKANQSEGLFIGVGDQENYLKIVLGANGTVPSLQVVYENNGVATSNSYSLPGGMPAGTLDLFLSVDPATGKVQPKYSKDGGQITNAGPAIQVSGPLLQSIKGQTALAVGIISTARGSTPFTATWDFMRVTLDAPTNIAPVLAAIGNKAGTVNQAMTFTAQATDADVPGQTLTFSVAGPSGAKIGAATGVFTWTPTASGVYSLTVKVSDNGSPVLSDEEIITVNVADGAIRINSGGPAFTASGGRVFSADTYFSGGTNSSVSAATAIANTEDDALYQNDHYGTFTYNVPVTNGYYKVILHFAETFPLVVDGSTTRDFHLDIEGVRKLTNYDIAQRAGGVLKAIQETIGVTVTDGVLNISFIKGTSQSPTISAFEIVPASAPANEPPIVTTPFIDQSSVADEAFSYTYSATAFTDPEGQPITLTAGLEDNSSLPSWLSFNTTTRVFSGTPPKNCPNLAIKVTATDSQGGSASDIFWLTVITPTENVPPMLAPIGNKTATVGQPLNFRVRATDSNLPAQTITYSVAGPASATMNPTTGDFSWTPATTGTFSLTIKATDNGSPVLSAQEVITVTVTAAQTGNSVVRINAAGSAYFASGNRVFVTDTYFDGGLTATVGNVPIDNTEDDALYQAERYGNFSYNIPLNSGYYNVILHFAETYSGVINGTVSRKFNVDMEGIRKLTEYDVFQKAGGGRTAVQETFGISVTDGTLNISFSQGSSQSPKVNAIEVTPTTPPANQPPVVANPLLDQTATVGTSFAYQFAANSFADPNGDAMTYTATLANNANLPSWLSFTASTRRFSGTPPSGSAGSITVKVTARDGKGGTSSDDFVITINVPNQAPVLTALSNQTIATGETLNVTAQATDANVPAQTLTYSLTGPSGASINANTGVISWTPTRTGTSSFTVKVTDNGSPALSDQKVFTVTVILPAIRINAGGPSFAASGSRQFAADAYFSGGSTANAGNVPIDNTVDDALYQTERFGDFSYAVPVSNGYYNLILHFAETFSGVISGSTTRKFHVDVEGVRRLTEYDIAQKAGGTLKAMQETLGVNVTDGTLNVAFSTGSSQSPKVNAIEIVPATAPANQAPVLTAISNQTLTAGQTLSLTAQATDPDFPVQTLTYSVSGPSGASINASTGAFNWTPTTTGTFSLSIKATDNGSPALSDQKVFSVTVSAAAQSLVSFSLINATSDQEIKVMSDGETVNLATLASRSINIRANTSPATVGSVRMVLSGPLNRTQVDNGAPYALFGNSGSDYTGWTPAVGSYTLTATPYTATAAGGTAGTPLTISFTVIDQAPVTNTAPVLASIGNKIVTLGQPLSFTAQATDSDVPAQTLTYSVSGPSGASINASTGAFSWTPTTTGTFSLTIKAADNGSPALSDQKVFSVTVSAAAQSLVSFSLINATSDQEIKVMSDGETVNLATLASRSINIRANTNPGTVGSVRMVLSGKQSRNQVDNGAPYALFGDSNGNFNNWAPAVGSYTLTATPYTATAAGGTAGTPLTISFTVIDQAPVTNTAPVLASIGNKIVTLGQPLSFTAQATDSDVPAQTLTYSVSGPSGASINASTGAFNWTPTTTGTFSLSIKATDNGSPALSDQKVFSVTVSAAAQSLVSFSLINATSDQEIKVMSDGETVNLATLASRSISIRANTSPATVGSVRMVLSGPLNRTQVDNGAPYALFGNSGSDYTSWTPAVGSYTLTATPYTATAAGGTAGTPLTISFTVIDQAPVTNTAPVLASIGNKIVTLGQPLSFTAQATDSDVPAQTLTYSLTGPASASINASTGAFNWTPTTTGTVSLTIKVTDSGSPALSAQEVITVTVNTAAPTNQPPVVATALVNQSAKVGTAFSYQFSAGSFTDADGDALTYTASLENNAALPAWLSFNASSRTFSGTPTSSTPASLSVKVTANDGKGGSVSSSFVISISPANSAPVLASVGDKTITLGQTLSFTAQATDSDVPAQTLTYSVSGPSGASINASTGAFSWTPTTTGTFSLTIKAADNGSPALSDQKVFSVTVSAAAQSLVSFSLINATSDQEIKVMSDGETVNLATLASRSINIRANTNPGTVGSVRMVLSGKQSRNQVDNGAPYALFGDSNGNFNNWAPAVGSYTLTATPYTATAAGGTAGTPLTISFTVIDQASGARILTDRDSETAEIKVTYSPNPFYQYFTLKVQGKGNESLPIVIYDMYGRESLRLEDAQPEQTIHMGKEYVPGVYLLQLGVGKTARRYRIIKTQ
ncbi:putative Ig domain-containing protein [Larkinella insperata]|nr:putative Ig domain-containing protein [Larkinella insperata]